MNPAILIVEAVKAALVMTHKNPTGMNVMLFPQACANGTVWMAQCVDLDFAAQGATIEQAQVNFTNTVRTHIALCVKHGEKPFENVPAAPSWFAREFQLASESSVQPIASRQGNGPRQMVFKHAMTPA